LKGGDVALSVQEKLSRVFDKAQKAGSGAVYREFTNRLSSYSVRLGKMSTKERWYKSKEFLGKIIKEFEDKSRAVYDNEMADGTKLATLLETNTEAKEAVAQHVGDLRARVSKVLKQIEEDSNSPPAQKMQAINHVLKSLEVIDAERVVAVTYNYKDTFPEECDKAVAELEKRSLLVETMLTGGKVVQSPELAEWECEADYEED
jgi:polyhydroxyalkanoate synthesis regulator phasin